MKHKRLKMPAGSGYQPEYDLAPTPWQKGEMGEYRAANLLDALQHEAVEVKTDYRAKDRIFVEIQHAPNGLWEDSGILDPRSEAKYWVFVLGDGLAVMILAEPLRRLARRMKSTGKKADRGWGIVEKPAGPNDECATRGVVFPLDKLAPWLREISMEVKNQDA